MSRHRAVAAGSVAAAIGLALIAGTVIGHRAHGASAAAGGSSPSTGLTTTQVRRVDLAATDLVDGTLGWSMMPPISVRRPGTWTQLPAPGSIVTPGHQITAVDGRPIVLLLGAVPAWRGLGPGVPDGPDVVQLERNLRDLGFDPHHQITIDAHFTYATAAAVRRLQHALAEPVTGIIDDGDVVFEPGDVRVGAMHAVLGGPARSGDVPFEATGTTRQVVVQLDPGRQRGVAAGQMVTVDLLDGSTTAGTISALARVATVPGNGTGGPAANGPPTPSVAMTVSLANPSAGGGLDQAPVQVRLTTATRTGVLAVPITALLALAEGGYGVEVVEPAGAHRIAAVTPGLFADTLVEITGGGLADGTTVVTAR